MQVTIKNCFAFSKVKKSLKKQSITREKILKTWKEHTHISSKSTNIKQKTLSHMRRKKNETNKRAFNFKFLTTI